MNPSINVSRTEDGKIRLGLQGDSEDEWAYADMPPLLAAQVVGELLQALGGRS